MKKLIILIFLLKTFLTHYGCDPKTREDYQESLHIEVSTNKNVYIKGEPIWLSVTFRNSGSADFKFISKRIWFLLADSKLKISLIDLQNQKYPYSGGVLDYRWSGKYEILKPDEEYHEIFNLTNYYGIPYLPLVTYGDCYLNANFYSLFLVLYNRIASNPVMFRVKEPEGDNLLSFNLIKEAYASRTWIKRRDLLREICDKYQHTSHAETALNLLSGFGSIAQEVSAKEEAVEFCFEFLEKYPDSNYTISVVKRIALLHFNLKEYDQFNLSYNRVIKIFEGKNEQIIKIAAEVFQTYEGEAKKIFNKSP